MQRVIEQQFAPGLAQLGVAERSTDQLHDRARGLGTGNLRVHFPVGRLRGDLADLSRIKNFARQQGRGGQQQPASSCSCQ